MKKDGKKGFTAEFKEFITRGNVVDMAVGVIVGSALVHTLLADDNKTARDPKEGLKLLAAKSEELAEGIHNAR